MSRFKNIDGADKLSAALKKLPAGSAKEVAAAMNKGAEEVATEARIAVPVDTGRLKNSIDIRREAKGQNRFTVKIVAGTDKATAISARAQEFGRRPGPNGHPGHAKQPFMWPAYWKVRKRIRGRIKRAMRKAVKGVLGNG